MIMVKRPRQWMIRTATPTAKSCGRPLAISVPLGGRIRPSPGCPAAGVTSLSTPYFFSTALPSSPDPLFAAAASFDGPPKDAFSQQQKQQQHASSYHVPKAWLDESRPVERRVQELLEASTVHPADFSLLQGLVKQCCQRGTLEGMQLAQDVMDRLLVEKKRWQQRQQSGSSGVETLLASSPPDGDKNNNDNKTIHSTITNMKTPIVIVPMNLFQTLLYGWACLAGNLRVAQTRMDQVLQLALEEAKQDDAAILTVNQSKPNDIDINDNSSASRSTMNDAEWQPTVQLFNTYLFGLSKAARLSPQAALHGEATLYEMAEHSRKFGWHTKPNTRSYTLVFMAYANAAPHNAAASSRALKLLSTMKQVHTSERLEYDREYAIPYNAQVRHPGVLSATPPENDAPNSTNRRQIVTPDTIVYTTIMKALIATKPHINDKAGCSDEVITLFGEALQSESVGLDAGLFLMTLSSLSATIETQGSARVRIEIAKQADQVLDFMKMALENVPLVAYTNKISNVRSDMTLTSRTTTTAAEGLLMGYNACMDTWARAYCEEAAPKCQAMLQDMIKGRVNNILPNTVSFNTCMYAWSRAHKFHVNAAQKAEDLFFKQRKLSKVDKLGDRVKPDFQTYTTCIMSLVESKTITNKMKRALRLLDFILDSVSRGEMPVSRNPNAPFSAALSVIASCDDKTIEQKGTSLSPSLDKTNDNSVDGFTAVVDTDTDPYTVAKSIFAQVDGDAHGIGTFVDHHVATSFLRCISTHCATGSTERQHTATRVFESACSDGQVSRSVVEGIKDALGPGIESFPHFFAKRRPKSWSRNVEIKFR